MKKRKSARKISHLTDHRLLLFQGGKINESNNTWLSKINSIFPSDFVNFTTMDFQKFTADHIFTGEQMLGREFTLIVNANGTIKNIIRSDEAGDDVHSFSGILCPGFINAHCHLELSHLKDQIPKGTGLVPFLLNVMKLQGYAKDAIERGIIKYDEIMLRNGIVAVGDICNTSDTAVQKKQSTIHYHNFIEITGFSDALAEKRYRDASTVLSEYVNDLTDLKNCSIVPHARYSVSNELYRLIGADPRNKTISIHNQESTDENDFFLNGTGNFRELYKTLGIDISGFTAPGLRTLESSLQNFKNGQSIILVHNVATENIDLQNISADHAEKLFFCLCPKANLYISGRLPDIDLFIARNCRITIGTDSLASNDTLDILAELKSIQKNFPHLHTSTLLSWATLNGARALSIDSDFGTFDPGKKPGVLWINDATDLKIGADSTVTRLI